MPSPVLRSSASSDRPVIRALLAILLLLGAAACGDRYSEPAPPVPKPAIWVIEDASGEALGWLFGTIHALPEETVWETPALTRVIDAAGVLVVEVRNLDSRSTGATFQRLARDEPVPSLAERVQPALRDDLAAIFDRTETPPDAYDRLETWAAALALARLAGTTSSANGVDQAVIARFAGRPVEELEGAEEQLSIFDRLAERDQRSLLVAVIREQDDPEAEAQELAKAWLAGDLAQLERTTRRGLLSDPALYRALSAERNQDWVAKLVPLLASGRRPLVAVGTAHMLGSDGLPALLGAKGYSIRRIQ